MATNDAEPGNDQEPRLASLVSQFGAFFFDERRHRPSLPLIASWMSQTGRPEVALSILDRFFRIGADGPKERLLEAVLAGRLLDQKGAIRAYRRAFELDPEDLAIQRGLAAALVEAGLNHDVADLAERLIGQSFQPRSLALALSLIRPERPFFGVIGDRPGEDRDKASQDVTGWCVWGSGETTRRLEVVIDGREGTLDVEDAKHGDWLALGYRYGTFRFTWPKGAAIIDVRDDLSGSALRGSPLVREDAVSEPMLGTASVDVTIIVPVYEDALATRRCFDALLADQTKVKRRIVVVDDATPNPMIGFHLERLSQHGRIDLLRNPANLGFVRSVNRALRHVNGEDVVLLNADAVVPPLWLDRMRDVAAGERIGTVTPLSNNGQLVSIPNRFRANEMPSPADIQRIDALAQAAGFDPVDMPNGVGFCLYITNAALKAAGPLNSDRFGRGYLEEVDLCLRIDEAGFRNVCATNVYVGHQGAASFGDEKERLVAANGTALNRRWPRIAKETAAFLEHDPLADVSRHVAFLSWRPRRPTVIAIVSGHDGEVDAIDAVAGSDADVLLLAGGAGNARGWSVRFPGVIDWVNVSMGSEGRSDPRSMLSFFCERAEATKLILVVDAMLDPDWLALVADAGLPVQVLAADAAVMCLAKGERGKGHACSLVEDGTCPGCDTGIPKIRSERQGSPGSGLHRSLDVLTFSPSLLESLRDVHPASRLLEGAGVTFRRGDDEKKAYPDPDGAIGIVPPDDSARTYAFIKDLGRAFLRLQSDVTIVVLGATMSDVSLMRLGNVFVTGPLGEDHPFDVLDRHRCRGLLFPVRTAHYPLRPSAFIREAGFPFATYPIGAGYDLLKEGSLGLPLDKAWTFDQLARVIERNLSLAGIERLRPVAGARPA